MATSDKLIEVKNLKKYYNGEEIKALDGVSVDINKGDVMVIIGPSGSGKSTFLRSLNLLEVPTSGEIIFEGVDITKKKGPDGKKLNIDLHRQKMGMVFQHFNLFPHKTVLQNMTLAPIKVKGVPQAEAEAKALELLDRVGLKDRADAYPIQLSGGQKQRVAIVRALAMEPDVMLFDEPTSVCPRGRQPRALHGRGQAGGGGEPGADLQPSAEPASAGFPVKGTVIRCNRRGGEALPAFP